jgi:hypothetical protein
MSDIEELKHEEKVFLAGCIKNMIKIDGKVGEDELVRLPQLFPDISFDGYQDYLYEFECRVKNQADFWKFAGEIRFGKARETILAFLYDITVQDGFPDTTEMNFFNELSEFWKEKSYTLGSE